MRVSPALFTVCEGIYNPRTVPVTPDEALEICFRQVSRFRDHDDGSVSGKGSGEEDDAGMALLLATQWSMSVLDLERHHSRLLGQPRLPTPPATGTSSPTSGSRKSGDRGRAKRRWVEYTCRVCDRQFYDAATGVAHWREHFGLTECSSCGHVLSETMFRRHRTKFHEPKPFQCKWCSFRAPTQGLLTRHTKQVHTGPWFRCSRCLVVIRRWDHFVDHARRGICAGLNPG